MNKDDIKICLEEIMFTQEFIDGSKSKIGRAMGFGVASNIGGRIAVPNKEREKHNATVKSHIDTGRNIQLQPTISKDEADNFNKKSDDINKRGHDLIAKGEKGSDIAQGVLSGAYAAGGAFLLYKGIKSLYKKYKEAKTPEAKAQIKSQIDSKKIQLKKAKEKGKK